MNLSHKIQESIEQRRLRKGRKQLYCKNHLEEIRNFLSKNYILHEHDIIHKKAKINYRGEGKKSYFFMQKAEYIPDIHGLCYLKFYGAGVFRGKKCVKGLLKELQYQHIYQYGDSTQEFSISVIPLFLIFYFCDSFYF